jgi:hypothetical protein
MKVYQILSESNTQISEAAVGTAVKTGAKALKGVFKKTPPKGLAPSSGKAQAYRDALKANRAEAAKALAKADAAAKAAATAKVSSFPGATTYIMQAAGTGYLAYEYWQQISFYESELKKELATPGSSKLYKNLGEDAAKTAYRADADTALGSLIAQVSTLVAPGIGAKVFGGIGNNVFLKWVPFVGRGSRWVSEILKYVSTGKVATTARIGAIYWLNNTEEGKKFLTTGIVGSILQWTGEGATWITEQFATLLKSYDGWGKEYVNAAGEFIQKGTDAVTKDKPQYKPNDPNAKDADTDAKDLEVPQLRTRVDPKNPKIKFINNVQITDENGYLLTGMRQHIQYVQDIARRNNRPDPFANIKRDPTKQYDY